MSLNFLQKLCALQVFSHAKQTAEASLRGLDNADRSAGEATLPDHFQALLRRPGVQLPNGAISLRAGLVPRLQRLLASDAADLAERLADSDCPCAALPELEYQVQVGPTLTHLSPSFSHVLCSCGSVFSWGSPAMSSLLQRLYQSLLSENQDSNLLNGGCAGAGESTQEHGSFLGTASMVIHLESAQVVAAGS